MPRARISNTILQRVIILLRKVCRALEEAESLLIAVLLLVMTLFAVLQVVTRAMSITIIWMEEATRYCMIWLCFIGMALAEASSNYV